MQTQQQSGPLRKSSGQPETIFTLEYAYMMTAVTRKDQILIVGRDGKDTGESVAVKRVPGLKEFVAHARKAVRKAGGKAQILHFKPRGHGREMKAVAWSEFEGIAVRILPLPLDFPLDPDAQRNYDLTQVVDEFCARFATKH